MNGVSYYKIRSIISTQYSGITQKSKIKLSDKEDDLNNILDRIEILK